MYIFAIIITLLQLCESKVPSLIYKPNLDGSSLISTPRTYNHIHEKEKSKWMNQINKLYSDYKTIEQNDIFQDCTNKTEADPGKVCAFQLGESLGCTKESQYGLLRGGPCIFLYLENAHEWEPAYYNTSNLPISMTEYLRETIINTDDKNRKTIWVDCKGIFPADIELLGKLEYYPKQGFDWKYITSKKVDGYHGPVVVLKFVQSARDIVLNVQCKLYAPNIPKNQGIIEFEMLIN